MSQLFFLKVKWFIYITLELNILMSWFAVKLVFPKLGKQASNRIKMKTSASYKKKATYLGGFKYQRSLVFRNLVDETLVSVSTQIFKPIGELNTAAHGPFGKFEVSPENFLFFDRIIKAFNNIDGPG